MADRKTNATPKGYKMAQGTVKWFNEPRVMDSFSRKPAVRTFSCTSARLKRAGLRGLAEGQKVSYELATERGKTSAVNLKVEG